MDPNTSSQQPVMHSNTQPPNGTSTTQSADPPNGPDANPQNGANATQDTNKPNEIQNQVQYVEPPAENYAQREIAGAHVQWNPQTAVAGSIATHADKGYANTSPRNYKPGCIIVIPHVVSSINPAANMSDPSVGWVPMIGPVIGKRRPAIVVAVYDKCMVCLPVRTRGGRGFAPQSAKECLWLRRWNDDGDIWQNVTESQYLMIQPRSIVGQWVFQANSFIDLTRPFTVDYEYPMYRVGDLSARSWSRLSRLWPMYVKKGLLPLADQDAFANRELQEISVLDDFGDVRQAWQLQLQFLRSQNPPPEAVSITIPAAAPRTTNGGEAPPTAPAGLKRVAVTPIEGWPAQRRQRRETWTTSNNNNGTPNRQGNGNRVASTQGNMVGSGQPSRNASETNSTGRSAIQLRNRTIPGYNPLK